MDNRLLRTIRQFIEIGRLEIRRPNSDHYVDTEVYTHSLDMGEWVEIYMEDGRRLIAVAKEEY